MLSVYIDCEVGLPLVRIVLTNVETEVEDVLNATKLTF
jgi:hypothetical protein